ncbi:hypothetical protein Scep_012568 [Stephania cephalantha]|uniref:Uncharacterized protein n=1 Tax=Stephania cephalantha TaxID=152367 RepID=A0AAP0JG71_9MAGN
MAAVKMPYAGLCHIGKCDETTLYKILVGLLAPKYGEKSSNDISTQKYEVGKDKDINMKRKSIDKESETNKRPRGYSYIEQRATKLKRRSSTTELKMMKDGSNGGGQGGGATLLTQELMDATFEDQTPNTLRRHIQTHDENFAWAKWLAPTKRPHQL